MKTLVFTFIATGFFLISLRPAFTFEGPLQVKNQFPLFLIANPPYLEKASYEDSFTASISHSSTFMVKNSSIWSIGLDMEVTEVDLRFKKTIADLFEFGVDIPLLNFSSGFMDDVIESYHNAFGFPDYGRGSRPENRFLYEMRKSGKLILQGGNGRMGLGDIRLTVKRLILSNDPSISLMADVELPSGDTGKGFGGGNFDGGVAVLLDKNLGEKVRAYLNLGAGFPGDIKGNDAVKLRNFLYGGAGVEAGLWKHTALLGQVVVQDSPFPKTGISSIDRISVLLSLGARYVSEENSFEFSFTEDPNTAGAPDFSLNVSYKRRF